MRTDPTDTGGLFTGRRPGTAPVRYRALPESKGSARERADRALARCILGVMVILNLLFWGPIPAGCLWIASHVQYWTGNVGLGIFLGFCALLVALFGGLIILKRLDHTWVLVRRAGGYDQRHGVIGQVFATTAILGGAGFSFWLIFVGGLGPTLAPH